MKTRQGFVSNSSSTSFYIDASKYSKEKVEEAINKMLELMASVNGYKCQDISSICTVYETVDVKAIKRGIRMHESYDSLIIDPNDDLEKEKWPKKNVVVDSADDNSIPHSIQEFLESELNARRQHWG